MSRPRRTSFLLRLAVLMLAVGCGGSEPEPAATSASVAVAPSPPVAAPDLGAAPRADAADDADSDGGGSTGSPEATEATDDTGDAPPPEPAPDPLHGKVREGDSLSRILNRAGLGAQEIQRVTEALSPVMDPATIRIGQRYDIELDEGGDLVSFAFHLSITEHAVVERDDAGALQGKLRTLETETREEAITGEVESSLWAALTERGHSPALVDVIVDVFAYDIDFFTATRKGDRFSLVVERHEIDGELVRYGRVLAASYQGAAAGDQLVMWWEPDGGEGRYVDDEGNGVARTMVKSPLKYARVTSGFDPQRMHPVLHRVKSHQGVDYGAPEGTPVWAAADGKIVFRAEKGGAGNMVILRHPGGLTTLYMHLSRFADGQKVGDAVKAKTVIGYVGMTGLATGPHLHFGMQKNGRYVDPTSIESVRGPGVGKADRKRFLKVRDGWRERLAVTGAEEGAEPSEQAEPGEASADGSDEDGPAEGGSDVVPSP